MTLPVFKWQVQGSLQTWLPSQGQVPTVLWLQPAEAESHWASALPVLSITWLTSSVLDLGKRLLRKGLETTQGRSGGDQFTWAPLKDQDCGAQGLPWAAPRQRPSTLTWEGQFELHTRTLTWPPLASARSHLQRSNHLQKSIRKAWILRRHHWVGQSDQEDNGRVLGWPLPFVN